MVTEKKRHWWLMAPWCLLCCLLVSGCLYPDSWHDPDKLYGQLQTGPKLGVRPPAPAWTKGAPAAPELGGRVADLSLEQAVMLALQGNQELALRQLAPLLAGTFARIERGVFDPELYGEFSYARETASETSRSTRERFSVKAEDLENSFGWRQQLPTGTEIDSGLSYLRSRSNRTPEQQELRLGLTVTQALLRGFGPAVNLVTVRQAELETQASQYELKGFVEALLAEVEIAYWEYVFERRGREIYESSLAVARRQLYEIDRRIEVGVMPRNAAAAARAEVARRQQELLDAESRLEVARLKLLRRLFLSGSDPYAFQINPVSPPRLAAEALTDRDERLQLAAKLRPDLAEARLRRRQRRLELVRTRNGLLPKLELFIDLGKTGYAESFSRAWDNLDRENYDLTAGIRLSHYLGNRAAKARDFGARIELAQAGAAIANLENLIQLDVRLALNEVERARRQIVAGEVTRRLQEITLQAEQERFAVGAGTSLLVVQAERDLLQSRLAEVEAVIAYRIALVNLYLAEGSLAQRRGISLAGTEAEK